MVRASVYTYIHACIYVDTRMDAHNHHVGALDFHTGSQDNYGALGNRVGARLGLCGATRYAKQGSFPIFFKTL